MLSGRGASTYILRVGDDRGGCLEHCCQHRVPIVARLVVAHHVCGRVSNAVMFGVGRGETGLWQSGRQLCGVAISQSHREVQDEKIEGWGM